MLFFFLLFCGVKCQVLQPPSFPCDQEDLTELYPLLEENTTVTNALLDCTADEDLPFKEMASCVSDQLLLAVSSVCMNCLIPLYLQFPDGGDVSEVTKCIGESVEIFEDGSKDNSTTTENTSSDSDSYQPDKDSGVRPSFGQAMYLGVLLMLLV